MLIWLHLNVTSSTKKIIIFIWLVFISFYSSAFKQQAHLDTHLRIHTGVRPFKCSMPNCERTFTQLANLQYHIRNHDSQLKRAAASMRERVRCPICFKAYDSNPALERHMYEFHKIYDRPRN